MCEGIIAIVATAVGTILGWILAKIKFGKIHITLTAFEEEPIYTNSFQVKLSGKEENELFCLALTCTIQMYNSSQTSKSIRDCELVFFNNAGNVLFTIKGEDKGTVHSYGVGIKCDEVDIINIEPFISKNTRMVVYINKDNIDKMYQTKSIYFKYKNERLKQRKIKCKEIDFSKISRIYKEETPHE